MHLVYNCRVYGTFRKNFASYRKIYRKLKVLEREAFSYCVSGVLVQIKRIYGISKDKDIVVWVIGARRLSFANTFVFAHDLPRSFADTQRRTRVSRVRILLHAIYKHKKPSNLMAFCYFCGRDDWIRTSDFLHPMQALYQAELRPEFRYNNQSKKSQLLVLLHKFCI